jgi:adenylate kinase
MDMSRNSSKIRDIDDVKKLEEVAKAASKNAVRVSKAMGLSVKIISNNELIEELPNGEQKVIKKIHVASAKIKGLKKGTVLCRK